MDPAAAAWDDAHGKGSRERDLSFWRGFPFGPGRLAMRVLRRSVFLGKAFVIAGMLATWVAPSAKALGIFWSESSPSGLPGTSTIGGANLDGTGVNDAFITGASNPYGVAVDGNYIYWTNDTGIGRANLDGTGVNQSFITGLTSGATNAQGIAVDGNYIYWMNFITETIGRANLDGTGVNQNLISGVMPTGIAVEGNYIYWPNIGGTIGRANLDGTGANSRFITGINGLEAIAIDGTYVYWANYSAETIGRANLDGTGVNPSFITGLIANPAGLAVALVPEPATGLFVMVGVLGLAVNRRRQAVT